MVDTKDIFLFIRFTTLFQFLFCQLYNGGTVSPVKFQIGGFSEFTPLEILKVCIATFPVPIMALILYGKKIFESEN